MTDDAAKPGVVGGTEPVAPKPAAPESPSPDPSSVSPDAPARPEHQTGTTGQATPVGENQTTLDGTPAATTGPQPTVDEPSASPPAQPLQAEAAAPAAPAPVADKPADAEKTAAAEKPAAVEKRPEVGAAVEKPVEAEKPAAVEKRAEAAAAAEKPAEGAAAVEKPAAAPRPAAPAAERPAPPPKPAPTPPPPDPPIIAELKGEFGEAIVEAAMVDSRPTFVVNRDRMVEFAAAVRARGFDYPACISGVDWPDPKAPENSFREAVYHLRSMKTGEWVVLKARCPSGDPWLNSLYSVYRNADWNEREIYDLFGIEFRGHPDLRRILMPEDWTGHPLLKSYRMSTYYSPAGNERQK